MYCFHLITSLIPSFMYPQANEGVGEDHCPLLCKSIADLLLLEQPINRTLITYVSPK